MAKTTIMRNPNELFEMLSNPNIDVSSIVPINDDVIIVGWENVEEAGDIIPTVNVVIAAYVTAYARMTLYKYLDLLQKDVLYMDTGNISMKFYRPSLIIDILFRFGYIYIARGKRVQRDPHR